MKYSFEIIRVAGALPDGIGALEEAAAAEGVRNVGKLVAGWISGAERFDTGGAALFAAMDQGTLAGIGGTRRETAAGECAMRMHRFYVHPAYRRLGIGNRIAHAVIAHAFQHAPLLTCNARASDAAAPFWGALGFQAVANPGYTHILRVKTGGGA